jgi:hypothetical protein
MMIVLLYCWVGLEFVGEGEKRMNVDNELQQTWPGSREKTSGGKRIYLNQFFSNIVLGAYSQRWKDAQTQSLFSTHRHTFQKQQKTAPSNTNNNKSNHG